MLVVIGNWILLLAFLFAYKDTKYTVVEKKSRIPL